ncbi:MAG: peptidoglycan-binding domain-containing protein [Gammaproteobacteria bacterium]
MKIATLWGVGALTLALACTPLAFAGTGSSHGKQSGQTHAQAQDTQHMAGYRNWTAAKMQRVQKALIAHGADIKATGRWDDATRDAVKAFQKEHGLKPTGFPNQATVKALQEKPSHK